MIVTWKNYKSNKDTKEFNTLPSETQPDMDLKPREILQKFRRGSGQFLPHFEPIWNGEVEVPDLSRLSVQDRMDYLADVKTFIKDKKAELLELSKDVKSREKDAMEEAAKEIREKEKKKEEEELFRKWKEENKK